MDQGGADAVRWVTAFLDTPAHSAGPSERFWSEVAGSSVSERRGVDREFATLVAPNGEPYLKFQTVAATTPARVHLDLHTDDVDALAGLAASLGAEVRSVDHGYVVGASPGGLPFCVVAHVTTDGPTPPAMWPGGRSLVDQVCLDIPPRLWDAECRFWSGLTRWDLVDLGPEHPEFRRLRPPPDQALQVLLQRLDDDGPRVTAHLDLSADDRDAEVDRHLQLGATDPERFDWWTSLRDPAGRAYCVTRRPPVRP